MTTFANSPWFKYSALAVLGGASGYVLSKNSRHTRLATIAGALSAPLAVVIGAYFFKTWQPVEGSPPFMNEPLTSLDSAPKTGARLPEDLDPVKAKWFQGEKSGRYYASIEKVVGSYTSSSWWVLT